MDTTSTSLSTAGLLRQQIAATEEKLDKLKKQLADVEAKDEVKENSNWKWPLQETEYQRYARQLILPSIGTQGQIRLRSASVLIIGAGGLGCPAAAYLAGAGVGHIGVVDGDTVETSNLHRQIGHTTNRVGQPKVQSLVAFMRSINNLSTYTAHEEAFAPSNAIALVRRYTVVLDCTDHPAVRYLISDACVLASKPLVSAAALRTDGQLAVLNWPVGVGPCYRCLFPRPPPQSSQLSCAEGGILGPVVGVMGVLQALEAIRVLTSETAECESAKQRHPTLLLFSAAGGRGNLTGPDFRTVRLRGRRSDCFSCSVESPLRKTFDESSADGGDAWPDYIQFCGGKTKLDTVPLRDDERVSPLDFKKIVLGDLPHWLIDVREREFYDMGSIAGSINIPFSKIHAAVSRATKNHATLAESNMPSKEPTDIAGWLPEIIASDMAPIYVICRVGNDSQVAVQHLKDTAIQAGKQRVVCDIRGGISAWKKSVDRTIPFV